MNILTRITDLKIVCIYLCLPNDSLHQLKIFFGSLSNAKLKGSAHVLLGKGRGKNSDRVQISCSQFAICKAFWQFANELLHFF